MKTTSQEVVGKASQRSYWISKGEEQAGKRGPLTLLLGLCSHLPGTLLTPSPAMCQDTLYSRAPRHR